MDYYKILGVHPDAEDFVIKAAYKALATKYHPDVNSSPDAEQHFTIINEAYQVLSDEKLRKDYDTEQSKNHDQYDPQSNDEKSTIEELIKDDWIVASSAFPEADQWAKKLKKINAQLSLTYKFYLLESKEFHLFSEIGIKMKNNFIKVYFGENQSIQKLAEDLIMNNKKEVAAELNRLVKIVGGSLNLDRALSHLTNKFPESFNKVPEGQNTNNSNNFLSPDQFFDMMNSKDYAFSYLSVSEKNRKYSEYLKTNNFDNHYEAHNEERSSDALSIIVIFGGIVFLIILLLG
jgi:curved DNA-binding protein CbpA